jgi:hypothetical protein
MNDKYDESADDICKFLGEYAEIVQGGLSERWQKLPVEIYNAETYEAIGGLLARQATLTINLALTPKIWNGHIAPLILRSMTDAEITLAWILIDPHDRARKYILYGLGQEKLAIEHLKEAYARSGEKDERLKQGIEAREGWLNSQRVDFLTEVNVGHWAGKDTRTMAEEADCKSLYDFAYQPFSGPTHSMWQHVGRYNLRGCNNPLHKYHRVPVITEQDPDIDYVYRSAIYITECYERVDEKYGLQIDTPLPASWFVEEFDRIFCADKEMPAQE